MIPPGFEQLVRDHIQKTTGQQRDELTARDFTTGVAVRIRFNDGSFAYFESALFIEDRSRGIVAVFTEHNGYHVFATGNAAIVQVRSERHAAAEDEK